MSRDVVQVQSRLALSRAAPPRESRPARGGLDGSRDRPRGEVLQLTRKGAPRSAASASWQRLSAPSPDPRSRGGGADDLVAAAAARRRLEVSSTGSCEITSIAMGPISSRRCPAGRGATAGAARVRRPRAGHGALPRRPRHPLVRRPAADPRYALRRFAGPPPSPPSRFARARYRTRHGRDVHDCEQRAARAARVPRIRDQLLTVRERTDWSIGLQWGNMWAAAYPNSRLPARSGSLDMAALRYGGGISGAGNPEYVDG